MSTESQSGSGGSLHISKSSLDPRIAEAAEILDKIAMILYEKDRITLKGDTLRAIGNMLVAQREQGVGELIAECKSQPTISTTRVLKVLYAAFGPDTGKGGDVLGPLAFTEDDLVRWSKSGGNTVAPTTDRET